MNLKDLINILIDADKKNELKEETIEDVKDSLTNSIDSQKEEKVTEQDQTEKIIEVDSRDKRIKELEELLIQKDAIITQHSEQITALKELTSVNNPVNGLDNLSLEQIIQQGEF